MSRERIHYEWTKCPKLPGDEEKKMIAEIILGVIIGMQIAYAGSVLLLWNVMFEWYEWGYFEETGKSLFLKMANGFLILMMGYGYWAGKRLDHLGFFRKRIFLLGYILLFVIISIIIYKPIYSILVWFENLFFYWIFAIFY